MQGRYIYTWNSTLEKPNGESIFDQEVTEMIAGKKALDVGCGHGEFTNKCGLVAKEMVGFDVTDHFILGGLKNKRENVSFVIGNTKQGLPFENNTFDCAYIRKGPTSAYPHLPRSVKSGGKILGIHPGDDANKELPLLFPELFEATEGTPIFDNIQQRLTYSNFSDFNIEVIHSTEFIHSPIDILKMRCFGQHPTIYQTLLEQDLNTISAIFAQHATKDGLPITFSRYFVRAIV